MAADRERLVAAREHILNQDFAAARAILVALPDDPTAQAWLAKLDAMEAAAAPAPSAPAGLPPMPSPGQISDVTRSQATLSAAALARLRWGLAGAVILSALLMVVGFFAFSWLDFSESSLFGFNIGTMLDADATLDDDGQLSVTAMEIWMGRNNGEDFSLDLRQPAGGGLSDVRLLDRTLILIPFGALVLAWLAWNYGAGEGSRLVTLGLLVTLAGALLAYPLLWQSLSESDWDDDLRAGMVAGGEGPNTEFDIELEILGGGLFTDPLVQFFTDAISTDEQQVFGALALMAGLAAFAAEFALAAQRPA